MWMLVMADLMIGLCTIVSSSRILGVPNTTPKGALGKRLMVNIDWVAIEP
ncbi:hypothetical protein ACVWW4_003964 [Bradyrhizobium sp. LB7.1]